MKKYQYIIILAALMLTSLQLLAQEQVDTAAFRKIREAEMTDSHLAAIAHYLTDVSGPRLTNTPGYTRAAEWAVATMKKWGLSNPAMQAWGTFGKRWDFKLFNLAMTLPYAQPILAYAVPWSAGTSGPKTANVIILNTSQAIDTTYLKQNAASFSGKFVLIVSNYPGSTAVFEPAATRFTVEELANLTDVDMQSAADIAGHVAYNRLLTNAEQLLKKAGAVGLIKATGSSVNGIVTVQGFGGYELNAPEGLPKANIALEDGQKIKRLVASGHQVQLNLNIDASFSTDKTLGYNVIAEIPGSDPKLKAQVVMLGGHLDSWQAATGATDNAAGCAVTMEAIRLLDSLNLKPKRTIRIALWDGEEEGTFGSNNYVINNFRDAQGKLKPDQAGISAYFNLDNGTGKIRGIYAQGNAQIKPIFEAWFKPFKDLGAGTVTLKNTGQTDHIAFDWAGIPGFQFIQDPIDYDTHTHHTNMDNYDHLQIDDLKQAAIIVAAFVYQAANRQDLLPRKVLSNEKYVYEGQ